MKEEAMRRSECKTRRDLEFLIKREHCKPSVMYKCSHCDFQTDQENQLERHSEEIHSESLHGCDICDYQGDTSENLQHHQKALHDGRIYRCPTCGLRANKKSVLFTHFRRTHDEERIHILYNIQKSFEIYSEISYFYISFIRILERFTYLNPRNRLTKFLIIDTYTIKISVNCY